MHHVPGLYVAHSPRRGRGVFVSHALAPGDLIEVCPAIIIPKEELKAIDQTVFYNYYILWPEPEGSACLALGYGSLYNHSDHPNAEITLDLVHQTVDFKCIREVEADSELLIDYTAGLKDAPDLWFNPTN
jgi:hypothetical protein